MRKMSVEMPSNPQQNQLGMESSASIALETATMTGAGCRTDAAGDCLGRMVMRAVSFFGSAMTDHVASRKIAEITFFVTR